KIATRKILNDRMYGRIEVVDPLVMELMDLPAIRRLKDVSQFGVPTKYYLAKNGFSRWEHSVGVMILLKKLGASREEQVAGLLHDVSIPAFSHIGDWLFGSGKKGVENWHDNLHEEYIKKQTKIPQLLNEYDFDIDHILDEKRFGLLERPMPALCADRVDYALREFPLEKATICFNSLVNYQNEIVFASREAAQIFARGFLDLQQNHWASKECCLRYNLFTQVLEQALADGIINQADFFRQDGEKYILDRVENSDNQSIGKGLDLLTQPNLAINWVGDKPVVKKFRYVEPKYLDNDNLLELVKTDEQYRMELEAAREANQAGFMV
ncbi:MAG: HD domain-containing protein, partial [Patescibacteria group bacterium]